jgi:hypothetical protein
MELNIENSEQIRELLQAGAVEKLRTIAWSGETLAGAMHLACLEKEVLSTLATKHLFFKLLDSWENLVLFKAARKAMMHRGLWELPLSMKAEVHTWEILPIPLESQVAELTWIQFHRRFNASLQASGFRGRLPTALTGALHEMADNSLRHSGSSSQHPSLGAVGYFVEQGRMTFCVVDAGRGVLESLKTNPANADLKNDGEALQAAVLGHATSDPKKQMGNGFEEVHRALSDRNGRLRFRSGRAAIDLDGRGHNRNIDVSYGMSPAAGFQLVVRCVLDDFSDDSKL